MVRLKTGVSGLMMFMDMSLVRLRTGGGGGACRDRRAAITKTVSRMARPQTAGAVASGNPPPRKARTTRGLRKFARGDTGLKAAGAPARGKASGHRAGAAPFSRSFRDAGAFRLAGDTHRCAGGVGGFHRPRPAAVRRLSGCDEGGCPVPVPFPAVACFESWCAVAARDVRGVYRTLAGWPRARQTEILQEAVAFLDPLDSTY